MKHSIGTKLLVSGLVVLILIVFMIIASQVVGSLFKNTSDNLVIEYNELDAVQELKFSISQLILAPSSYAIYGNAADYNYFKIQVHKASDDLHFCEKVLTNSHDLELLMDFQRMITRTDSLGTLMFHLDYPQDLEQINGLLAKISEEVDAGIINIDLLLTETKEEINEYIAISQVIIKHSTITILSLGLVVALIILFGGWLFIRSLTRPINELVTTTNQISEGNRSAKVNIDTKDEFHTLAESFNKMMDTLEKTTVSRNYLDNILKNMFGVLVVTDNHLNIRSVNNAATNLLGYTKEELLESNIRKLFTNGMDDGSAIGDITGDIYNVQKRISTMEYLVTKNGPVFPALISCSVLKTQNKETDGLIIIAHDLTEKKAIEKKLDKTRKERLIDINEAQEEERMRIATDLHDGLGQILTAISYSVQELLSKEGSNSIIVNEPIVKIQQHIDNAIRETKNLAHNLIPIVLKDFGLIVAVENLISRANELYETKFRFDVFDFNERIDPKREKVLYRICQESLNNIIKHAQAKNATYQIYWQDCSVVLVIEDDGIGFDANAFESKGKYAGIGLIGMRERVLAFDGNFTINSEPGKGTEIIVELPCRIK